MYFHWITVVLFVGHAVFAFVWDKGGSVVHKPAAFQHTFSGSALVVPPLARAFDVMNVFGLMFAVSAICTVIPIIDSGLKKHPVWDFFSDRILQRGLNPLRWVDLALTVPLLCVAFMNAAGVLDRYLQVMVLVAALAAMVLCGLQEERSYYYKHNGWVPSMWFEFLSPIFVAGVLAGAVGYVLADTARYVGAGGGLVASMVFGAFLVVTVVMAEIVHAIYNVLRGMQTNPHANENSNVAVEAAFAFFVVVGKAGAFWAYFAS